jgi:sugar phosphate isomerase/epimerase
LRPPVDCHFSTDPGGRQHTWHYFRSRPDPALLDTIPAAKIFEVQLADATTALKASSLVDDLLPHRLLPDDEEFDIAGVTRQLQVKGAWGSVGPEVFADWIDALPAEEVGRRCDATLQRWSPRTGAGDRR